MWQDLEPPREGQELHEEGWAAMLRVYVVRCEREDDDGGLLSVGLGGHENEIICGISRSTNDSLQESIYGNGMQPFGRRIWTLRITIWNGIWQLFFKLTAGNS